MSEGDTTLREEDISSEQSLVGARAEVADVDGDDSTGTESDTDGTDLTRTTPTRTPTARTLRGARPRRRAGRARPVPRGLLGGRPLLVPRSEDGRFDDLLSQGEAERLVSSTGLRYPAVRRERGREDPRLQLHGDGFLAPDGIHRHGERRAHRSRVRAWRDRRHSGSPPLPPPRGGVLPRPRSGSGNRAGERVYTPRSAQGLPVHHDTHDVFCLQIAGEKRWLVYEPRLELPLPDQRYSA